MRSAWRRRSAWQAPSDLLPAQVIAYAIEGANFDPGAPISPPVAAVAGEVATRIAAELRRLAGSTNNPERKEAANHA